MHQEGWGHLAGNLVKMQSDCFESHRRTLNKGNDVIYELIDKYGIHNVNHATKYYQLLSAGLQEDVERYKLQLLASMLPAELMKDGNNKKVLNTALHLAVSMKRDWIQTGRKPSGICAAAIYVSSVLHGVAQVKAVHICEATLTKRLIEFENTTIEEFTQNAVDFEKEMQSCKQSANDLKMPGMTWNDRSGLRAQKQCSSICSKEAPADESDTHSDIDDSEINDYLLDEEESRLKVIWEHMPMNREWNSEEIREAQALAVASKKERDKRKRELEAKPAQTAAAAACQHFKKRLSSKINYDMLTQLFGDEEPSPLKNRVERKDIAREDNNDNEDEEWKYDE
ncbi:hypothetical protein L1987_28724 [Smallanthus sonchifolius]|uniref:Uncharacterized protein n=1 Tax=Smallanthus sonchifolius TaxID=185202 RepID=A0ACB9HYS3_9ASTR|nr:hypothetical protein L1987_28724 [Smallanthus sonchifolius]